MKLRLFFIAGVILFTAAILFLSSYFFCVPFKLISEGKILDELNGVEVYYNGASSHIDSRNVTEDGYNVGLRWQCVEFVKRYYLKVYDHKMPNSYGNAVDYFNPKLEDGTMNTDRGLIQNSNPGAGGISVGDILIFSGGYGHVAIVSEVFTSHIEVVQQNVNITTREEFHLARIEGKIEFRNPRILGWLSAPN